MLREQKIKIINKLKSFEFKVAIFIVTGVMIIFSIGVIAYSSFTRIVNGVTESIHRDGKVLLLKDILSEITDAENQVKSFTFTNDHKYLDAYNKISASTDKRLVDLKKLSVKDSSKEMVDSLSLLVHIKFNILKDLIALRDTGRVAMLLNNLSEKINPGAHSGIEKNEAKTDLLSKLLNRIQKKSKGNNSNAYGFNSFKDLQQELDRLMYLEAENTETVFKAQLELTERDKIIMGSIRDIFQRLEAAERKKLAIKTAEAEAIASRTNVNITVFLIALAGLLCTLGYFILRNIKKRREYEMQLQMAKLETEQLADAKELFLANMSHEIRTPLHAITGFSEQLMETDIKPNQKELLDIIKRSGDHLLKLVNNVLDLSKIHAGKLVEITDLLNIETLVTDAINVVRPMALKKNLELRTHIDGDIPADLYGDPVKFTQILINILSNAVKFTQKGKVELHARIAEIRENKLYLEVKIADTGIGISEDQLENIFDEFVQANNRESIKYGGTGLGLTISKKLCNFLGGSLNLTSVRDVGTTVIIQVPFEIREEKEPVKKNKAKAKREEFNLKGKKLLIADDELYNLKLLGILLHKWGADYVTAVNGKDVLNQLKQSEFDAVLIDLSMPEMDGFETAGHIRSGVVKTHQNIPILALTASADPEITGQCKNAGIDHVLTKPFLESELYKLLSVVFGNGTNKNEKKNNHKHNLNNDTMATITNAKLYNLEGLKKISPDDNGFMKEMVETFIESSSKNMGDMQDALSEKNLIQIREIAHSMIPSCRHLGMDKSVEMLKKIESIAKEGTYSYELEVLVEDLYEDLQMVFPELAREVSNQ